MSGDDEARTRLRERLRARRAALPRVWIEANSAALCGHVLASPLWAEAEAVVAFVGVRGEPDTAAILHAAWERGTPVWLPRVRGDVLEFVDTGGPDDLRSGCFGLIEPSPTRPRIDALLQLGSALLLVPGLGFDRSGARIGFGRGYYDRALAQVRDDAGFRRVGVAFEDFVADLDDPEAAIPMAAHDVPVQWLATERGLLPCARARALAPLARD